MRSKASLVVHSAYCGTAERICSFVSQDLVDSRQMTRLSSRSVRCAGAAIVTHATRAVGARVRGCRAWRPPPRRRKADMIQWREGRVTRGRGSWRGPAELDVAPDADAGSCRALASPALVGEPRVGELVLLNTTALEAGLGTGGGALLAALPPPPPPPPP